ncbi:helix-turn-helix transcriptional regulator [Mycolicibacterium arenosum]|uniref:LuxR C-terminal-related transcriptional regulator n=1 Tax=Mycolicibacterium arenosum TaxID=2952157 RepID=A0ABT1M4G1_9MYCO|nr:LuxR family transcriptional regulator [Mycolicibacterium sp. CAU 1645]MCP9274018.1 LuxR C-terminal-related transcriptional regulator [Mycolicibacterium sp. CAU 1645]
MRLSWPLIGRQGELRTLAAVISGVDASGALIRGPEGVGKSRLAREALTAAAATGCATRTAAGTSSARNVPLGAFTAWAPSGVTDTVGLVRGVIEALTSAPPAAKAVLAVDDAHLLDDLSTFVVHQIVLRRSATVLLTVRDDVLVGEATREIWRSGAIERLELRELSLDDTRTLLEATLGGPFDGDSALRLWQLTRGNTLYLQNIVEQEVTDGRIVEQHGCWRWIGDPILPPGLVELIECRVGALPERLADVVDTLAVGEPIELATLSRLTEAEAIEEAETRGLITLHPAGNGVEVRLAHPLYGESRRTLAPRTRLRRLRGRVVTELGANVDGDDVRNVVRRGALSLDCDLAPDPQLLVDAARGAVWLGDLSLADQLAQAASAAGAGPEPSLVRAHALSWLGRGEDAAAVLAAVPYDDLTDHDRARFTFLQCSNMLWALGDPARAKALADDASRRTPRDARMYIDAFHSVYWFAVDQPAAALEAAEHLVPNDLPVVGAEVAWAVAQMSADAGRTTRAISAAHAGYAAATRSLDAPHTRFNIADAEVGALLLAGRISEAREVAVRVRDQSRNLPGAAHLLGDAVAGRAALAAGDLRVALPLLRQAAESLLAMHPIGWGYRYGFPYVTALAAVGMTTEAATALAALGRVNRGFRSLDYERGLARAWVAAAEGAVTEARAVLLAEAEKARATGRFAAEVFCLQLAVQFGDRTAAARLLELTAVVEGPRVAVAARFAAALAVGDAEGLATASQEFERMDDLVAAIDAAAHTALAYRSQDRRGSALTWSTRADALAERCGVSTPALRQASESLPLTDREIEIAMLIGEGLTNRAIAERLTLSVRTVESHVFRAMKKAGSTSRDELGALLRQRTATR